MALQSFTWLIGSADDADVIVRESAISRRHCRLRLTPEGFRLEELGSTNRTFVNGEPIAGEVSVMKADKITLGQNVPMPWPKLDLPARTISIGRASDNDVVLDFENVSSRHARLATAGETLTIEDTGSTNGIFVGNPPQRVKRAKIGADETVRFGTLVVPVAKLLLSAFSPTPQPRQAAPEPIVVREPDVRRTTGEDLIAAVAGPQRQTTGMIPETNKSTGIEPSWRDRDPPWAYAIVGAAVCGLLIVAFSIRTGTKVPIEAQIPAVDANASASVGLAPPSLATPEVIEPLDNNVEPPSATNSGGDALGGPLFLVLVSNPASGESYRLGTAWAAAPDLLITTASVATALENQAFRERFPDASVREPTKGQSHKIEQLTIHPRYRELRQSADLEITKYEQAIDARSRLPEGSASRQTANQSIQDQFSTCTAALEKTVAFDVATIRFGKPLASQILELAVDSTPLRPKLKLTVRGLAFDNEDPFFDPREATTSRELDGRVIVLPAADGNGSQHLVLEASMDHRSLNYLGSPIQSSGGQVIAMYSRATPPLKPDEKLSGKEFDAVNWTSIQDLIK